MGENTGREGREEGGERGGRKGGLTNFKSAEEGNSLDKESSGVWSELGRAELFFILLSDAILPLKT